MVAVGDGATWDAVEEDHVLQVKLGCLVCILRNTRGTVGGRDNSIARTTNAVGALKAPGVPPRA